MVYCEPAMVRLDRPAIWSAIVYCLLSCRVLHVETERWEIWHSIRNNSTQSRMFKSESDCGRVAGTIKGENHNREIRQLLSTRDTRKICLLDCSGNNQQWYSDGTYWLFSAVFIVWIWHDLIDTYQVILSLGENWTNQRNYIKNRLMGWLEQVPTPSGGNDLISFHIVFLLFNNGNH